MIRSQRCLEICCMSKSVVTKYENISAFSGSKAECLHHLVFGRYGALRSKADKDGLWIPLTNSEHNMSSEGLIHQIHDNPAAENLSKMLGQMAWERHYLAKQLAGVADKGLDYKTVEEWFDEAREAFRKEYGESFL